MNIDIKKLLAIPIICVALALGAVYFLQNKSTQASTNDGWKIISEESTEEPPKEAEPEEEYKADIIKVYITGAVENPDVYELPEDSRIVDILELAGGATSDATLETINLSEHLFDAAHIVVPRIGDEKAGIVNKSKAVGSEPIKETKLSKININTATSAELQTLQGVGQVTADRIIAYREKHGSFSKTEDLMNVERIGQKTFESLKDYITVE